MRRFGHGHSLALGAILTLLVERNGWLVLVGALLIFTAGIVAGRSWHGIRSATGRAGDLLAARVATERERRAVLRASRRVKLQGVKAKRAELEKEYKRGVIDGHLDAQR